MDREFLYLEDIIAEIRNGLDTSQYDVLTDGMLAISRIETISDGTIDFKRVKYAKVTEAERKKYELRQGDILFSHINSPEHIGKTALFRSDRTLIHGINLLLLRCNQKRCHPEYLNYYLKTVEVRTRFRTRCKRAVNQASLNQGDILSLEVPLPPLGEQKRIAAILSKADRLRRLRRYARELSDGYLQSVFLEMFGESLKSVNPQNLLGDLVTITGGGTPSREVPAYYEGHIPWLTAKDMIADYITDTQEHITKEAIKNSATKLVPEGSVLVVVKSKALMHRLPVAITKVALCHGQDIKSIQCSPKILPEFLVYILKYNTHRLLYQARGANTEGLTLPMLREVPVPAVSFPLQQKFVQVVQKYERLRAQQRESARQGEHLFQSLLHRAFRGEI
jgi:type I restriction enzyme S subunit